MKISDRHTAARSTRARRLGALAAAGLAAVVLAACSSNSTASSGSSPSGSSTGLQKVTMAADIFSMSNASLYVALNKGYFKDEGLDLENQTLQSGSTTGTAMQSGKVNIAASASFEMGPLVANGSPFLAFYSPINVTTEFCASNSFIKTKGISTSSSLSEIAAAFKGATIGISGPNSTPDLIGRYFFGKLGGLDPNKDLKIVALGSQPAVVTALTQGQVDGFFASPPTCSSAVSTGKATMLLRPSQVPAFVKTPQNIMYTTKSYAKAHPDVLKKISAAMDKAIAYTKAHPDDVVTILKTYMPTVDDATIKSELTGVIIPAIPATNRMSATGWKDVSDIIKPVTGKDLDTKQGAIWSNAYLAGS